MQQSSSSRVRPLILIADDDQVSRMVLAEILNASGFDVVEADDGAAAVECAIARNPDMIVLDVVMPRMDGFEACSRLRAHPGPSDTPILMLTGREDAEAIASAFQAGATDFAVKPIVAPLLLHRVRFLLRARSTLVELRSSEASLAEAQRIAGLGSWSWDADSGAVAGSPEGCRLFGLEPGRVCHVDDIRERIHPDDVELITQRLATAAAGKGSLDQECRLRVGPDAVRHVHLRAERVALDGSASALVHGTVQDITERVLAAARIHSLSNYDPLCGLPNRHLFNQMVEAALANARRRSRHVGVMLLDINRLKRVNDSLGHAAGDAIIRETARRLRDAIRAYDIVSRDDGNRAESTLARFEGDEFMIALPDLNTSDEVAIIADRLLNSFAIPFVWEGRDVFLSASVGISVFPDDALEHGDLIRHAAAALNQAKERESGVFAYFNPSMNDAAVKSLALEMHLRNALDGDEITVHYQPQVDGVTRRVVSVEALLRWTSPHLGPVGPAQFVPLAEKRGLIVPVTELAVQRTCEHIAEWKRDGGVAPLVAINVSPLYMRTSGWIDRLLEIMAAHGVEPACIELEITESTLLDDQINTARMVDRLKLLGFRIALDDFGTGYSSFGYLSNLAFDTLKIDKSFVQGLAAGSRNLPIVTAILGVAQSLGMRPLAEGVACEEERSILLSLGCATQQGFLYGRAGPAAEVAWPETSSRRPGHPLATEPMAASRPRE